MLRSLVLACAVVGAAVPLAAAEMKFPYEAIVAGDDVVVRSGPGKNYYATSKLERDTQLVVHRHDPGGWYMISPPQGSISWIEASLVDRQGNRGIVNVPADEQGRPGQAVVRIGSTLSDDHGYTGRRLASGDEVEIIGEQTLAMPQGPVRMLQIVPPLREYRWVKGDFIVPADPALRQHADSDPYAVPSHHRGTPAAAAIANDLPPLPSLTRKAEKKVAEADDAPSPEVMATHGQRMQLLEIDNRYADMMAQDISQWQPGELRAAYQALRSQVDSTLAAKIDVRLSALAEREKLYENYARFAQLTAATERRDAELLGMVPPTSVATAPSAGMNVMVQAAGPGAMTAAPSMAQSMPVAPPAVQLGQPSAVPPAAAAPTMLSAAPVFAPQQGVMQAGGVMAAGGIVQAGGTASPMARGGVVQASGVQPPAGNVHGLAGAGIIQATNLQGSGVPQFMITAADGRFLAFIESSQVNLGAYLGQSMGLVGARSHQPRLRSDLIQVQSLSPVQLGR